MRAPVYLLSGEEFLAEEALERIRSDTRADALSEVSFDAAVPPSELLGALETATLLGGVRLVVVRGAHDLKTEQTDALRSYLSSPSPDSVLVLIATGRTKLDAAVKNAGAIVSLDPPKGRQLAGWIRERARTHRLRLDDRSGWALIDSVGTELRDLDAALEQLSTSLGRDASVGAAEVRKVFPRLADQRVFTFTDAVGDRRLPLAMSSLRRLLEQGDEPVYIFNALVSHVRNMLRARRVADAGSQAVGRLLGLPAWRAERLTKQARSYREDELIAAMTSLAAADVELKSGESQPESALERVVVQIVSS